LPRLSPVGAARRVPLLIVGRATATPLALARRTARRAATRLVREALLREELLLARREGEGAAAVAAAPELGPVGHECLPTGHERGGALAGARPCTGAQSIAASLGPLGR